MFLYISISFSQVPNISPQIEVISPNLPPVLRQPQQNEQMLLEKKEDTLKQDKERIDETKIRTPSFTPSLVDKTEKPSSCLLYTSPSPRDRTRSRMPSSA